MITKDWEATMDLQQQQQQHKQQQQQQQQQQTLGEEAMNHHSHHRNNNNNNSNKTNKELIGSSDSEKGEGNSSATSSHDIEEGHGASVMTSSTSAGSEHKSVTNTKRNKKKTMFPFSFRHSSSFQRSGGKLHRQTSIVFDNPNEQDDPYYNTSQNPSSSSSSSSPCSTRESRSIAILRFAVVLIWLVVACCVTYGVRAYTWHSEFKQFEIQYKVDAEKILDRFQTTIDQRLVATNTLATTLTMHVKATNQSFPFVTMPDYVVAGSNARILADAAIIHWLPLVTDDNREEWEEYAFENRHQVDEEFEKDEAFRRQEDIRLGYNVDGDENRRRELQQEQEGGVEEEAEDLNGDVSDADTTTVSSNDSNNSTNTTTTITDGIVIDENGVVQDGSGYHYQIFSQETKQSIPEGSGPFLPIWQRSPVNGAKQASLNIDMGRARGLLGIFPYWSPPSPSNEEEGGDNTSTTNKPKGALLHRAIIPHPNVVALHDKILLSSQYRHQAGPYGGTPTTKLAYPVFDGFGDDAKFVGVLATTIYWRLSFSDIFRQDAKGMLCVVENTFGQTFSYRIDGAEVTYLGEGDPLEDNDNNFIFEDMMITQQNSPGVGSQRPLEERRSFTTLPLDEDFGEYTVKIYPTQDTYSLYKGSLPVFDAVLVVVIFVVAAVVFLLYDFYVQKRHKTMLANGIEQAHRAAVAERELNEYLAHEVRNPLSAAISACSFVSSAVAEAEPLKDEESRQSVRDDVHIIKSSLQFINDLLRNMLDLHRAVNHQVVIQKKSIDLYHDVLEPVTSMLYGRDHGFEVQLDCPENLLVETDSLRLRQIVLNLGRNAAKFVEKGFVRLRGQVVDSTTTDDPEQQQGKSSSSSTVRIYVEDSGPGIPVEKRKALFAKFQQSLDLLNQGTGVGLCLCKQLVDTMGGNLWLDESYDSGIEGCPGSRFVVDLKTAPSMSTSTTIGGSSMETHDDEDDNDDHTDDQQEAVGTSSKKVGDIESAGGIDAQRGCSSFGHKDQQHTSTSGNVEVQVGSIDDPSHPTVLTSLVEAGSKQSSDTPVTKSKDGSRQQKDKDNEDGNGDDGDGQEQLPKELSVLFVDDDMILRKLFSRSIKRVLPGWKVKEASSGETAIRLVETGERFDLIFMDQYMASTEKQLLGTEATRELRAKGVTCTICGLSANEKKEAFLKAGADGFMLKPVPCDKDELKRSLLELFKNK